MTRAAIKQTAVDLLAVIVGDALVALGLVMFTVPNDIAPGGVSGLATALAHIAPLSVGVWTLLLNLPLIALAWWKMGLRPLAKTLVATVLLSLFIEWFTRIVPVYTNDALLAAIAGGVLCGIGMGLIFLRGASTGGTDLVSLLLNRAFPNLSVGFLLLAVDSLVVVFAMLVFRDIEVALYSVVTIFATTRTIDAILEGVDHAKVLTVITANGDEMTRRLTEELELGVTVMKGKGGFTKNEKDVLMIVVRRSLFSQTLRLVKSCDPKVFLYIANAAEVYGEGFKG